MVWLSRNNDSKYDVINRNSPLAVTLHLAGLLWTYSINPASFELIQYKSGIETLENGLNYVQN